MKVKNLLVRAASGIVYVALIVGCIIGGKISTTLLCCLLAGFGTLELSKVLRGLNQRRMPLLTLDIAGSICLALGCYLFPLIVWFFCMILRFVEALYIEEENPVSSLSESCLTQALIGVPCGLMLANATYFTSGYILLSIFLFLWINDTGAFLVGSTIGRHKLFERISPKKSWEGFFGGLFFNIVFALIFNYCCSDFFGYFHNVWQWIGLAVIVTVFGTWGDLVESMIKRTMNLKDSGNIIPGHGGLLDRIDSMLLAMPACFIYFVILSGLSL
ncbi:MAG: phosphatidate cytidylyltransferase [Prevotella sp.]|nr:phosphatidate cytidylyltransferase [Bacteroides sp.]MCM1365643.1 phosphatidate cytidylyltransferase [Prevotella sp.]